MVQAVNQEDTRDLVLTMILLPNMARVQVGERLEVDIQVQVQTTIHHRSMVRARE